MLTDALNLAFECFSAPLSWFTEIWASCGALSLYLAYFFIFTFVRLIVRAYIGDAISDGVKEFRADVRRQRKSKSNPKKD